MRNLRKQYEHICRIKLNANQNQPSKSKKKKKRFHLDVTDDGSVTSNAIRWSGRNGYNYHVRAFIIFLGIDAVWTGSGSKYVDELRQRKRKTHRECTAAVRRNEGTWVPLVLLSHSWSERLNDWTIERLGWAGANVMMGRPFSRSPSLHISMYLMAKYSTIVAGHM